MAKTERSAVESAWDYAPTWPPMPEPAHAASEFVDDYDDDGIGTGVLLWPLAIIVVLAIVAAVAAFV